MAHDTWFISDTHFWHANCWKLFKDDEGNPLRPFTSTEEMNEFMIEKWNSVVKDGDKVYHLGDVTFRYDGVFNNIMSRLKGRKSLLVGNHDKLQNPNLFRWFEKVKLLREFREHNFTATHLPIRLDSLRDGSYCVHGHTHHRSLEDSHYINVSVEVTGYTPMHLDEIKEITCGTS